MLACGHEGAPFGSPATVPPRGIQLPGLWGVEWMPVNASAIRWQSSIVSRAAGAIQKRSSPLPATNRNKPAQN
jgi:hypothetical protein